MKIVYVGYYIDIKVFQDMGILLDTLIKANC